MHTRNVNRPAVALAAVVLAALTLSVIPATSASASEPDWIFENRTPWFLHGEYDSVYPGQILGKDFVKSSVTYEVWGEGLNSRKYAVTVSESSPGSRDVAGCTTNLPGYVCHVDRNSTQPTPRVILDRGVPAVIPIKYDRDPFYWADVAGLCTPIVDVSVFVECNPAPFGHVVTIGNTTYRLDNIAAAPLPNATVGQPYSYFVAPAIGVRDNAIVPRISGLPQGISVAPEVLSRAPIRGTPTTAGTWTITIEWLSRGNPISKTTASLRVLANNAPKITTTSLPATYLGRPTVRSIQVDLVGATKAESTIAATGLPPGLTLNAATWAITGTPTKTGKYDITVTVSTPSGGSSSKTLPFEVRP